jgi:hypothetical protein
MESELVKSQDIGTKKAKKVENKKKLTESDLKQRYVYSRQGEHDSIANRIEELLSKCNQKEYGAPVEFSSLVAHSIMLLKDSDISEIQNNSLSPEDKANEEVRKFNNQNGTNYTMFEFVLNGLGKKSKKGVNQ